MAFSLYLQSVIADYAKQRNRYMLTDLQVEYWEEKGRYSYDPEREPEKKIERLEVLAELLPADRRRLAVLNNPSNPAHARNLTDIAEQAPRLGFTPRVLNLTTPAAMPAVLAEAAQDHAMLVPHDFILFPARRRVVTFAAEARLPAVYENRFSPEVGGMASYGADLRENYRQGAQYVDRLLRGARVEDLPVVQPNRVELVINLAAVTALGLSAPPMLLARADEVIE
jgi:putative ABC transport system substrate-binding protein